MTEHHCCKHPYLKLPPEIVLPAKAHLYFCCHQFCRRLFVTDWEIEEKSHGGHTADDRDSFQTETSLSAINVHLKNKC